MNAIAARLAAALPDMPGRGKQASLMARDDGLSVRVAALQAAGSVTAPDGPSEQSGPTPPTQAAVANVAASPGMLKLQKRQQEQLFHSGKHFRPPTTRSPDE